MPSEIYPDVTILIPAYNQEDFIPDAIRSAVEQNYPGRIEVIVLDDGSRDASYDRAKRVACQYANVRVYSQDNRGRAGARNRLLELSSTELVAWLDGDDMASPHWIREQVELLNRGTNLVAVSGQGYAMDGRGLPIGPIDRPLRPDEIDRIHLSGSSSAFFQSCSTVRRSSVLGIGGYREEFWASEDYDLWLRLAEVGRLANCPACHLYYRVHDRSANALLDAEQKKQGLLAANAARARRGLAPLPISTETRATKDRKADWNRRIYWINIALKSGNPWTATQLALETLRRHPASLLVWIMLAVALADVILQSGNRTDHFQAGRENRFGNLRPFSAYRFARAAVHFKRRLSPTPGKPLRDERHKGGFEDGS